MATFSLSISSQYVPSWGPYEACREILQNACDSQQDGHPMHISHNPATGMLTIANSGVRLDRSVWLLGISSKTAGGYRGQYGEGFALGMVALVRAGRTCRIVNFTSWPMTMAGMAISPHERAEGSIFSRIVASTMDIRSRTAALASLACSDAAA